jgi:hypothetical protein
MGFYHTDSQNDVMSDGGTCDEEPSGRERYHAAIAYARPPGNSDPDNDPPRPTFSVGPMVVN